MYTFAKTDLPLVFTFRLNPLNAESVPRSSRSAPSKQIAGSEAWRWQEAPLLPLGLDDCQSVWLDVDLDAFCNRYDGDSDRAHILSTESERLILRQRMDRFLDRLSNASWKSRGDAVSIAASPGFFPSEYWDEAIPKITDGVADIVLVTDETNERGCDAVPKRTANTRPFLVLR